MKPSTSFTTSIDGIVNVLLNEAIVSEAHNPSKPPKKIKRLKFIALWDTGATNTVISKDVVKRCGLKPTGMTLVHTAGGESYPNTYLINIILRNNVEVPNLKVTEGEIFGNKDILIGMDIINMGDFAVTNRDGKTVFSFRIPSLECIDFVKNPYKESPFKAPKKVSRNDPCPCGSGKKYKNCCLNKEV